jgi:hypothetical protein
MPLLLDVVRDFFRAEAWPFSDLASEPALAAQYVGETGKWSCLAEVSEELQQCLFYSISPVRVPAAKQQSVAEYITRANEGLNIGNFEMSFETGEVLFKTSIDVLDTALDQTLVRNLAFANVITMDRFLPGLLSVIFGNASPREAVDAAATGAATAEDASPEGRG